VLKIVLGEQTGVDRAALDAAMKMGSNAAVGVRRGGSTSAAEFPIVIELKNKEHSNFADRTLQNIKGSDGTVIICFDKLRGDTAQMVQFCIERPRPHQLINAAKVSADDAANLLVDLVRKYKIDILNVGGPRQSEWPDGYNYAFRAIDLFLAAL
jgi:Circularly permutated YpsA SLOG family